jgi:hypothetical protein
VNKNRYVCFFVRISWKITCMAVKKGPYQYLAFTHDKTGKTKTDNFGTNNKVRVSQEKLTIRFKLLPNCTVYIFIYLKNNRRL